jgi:hypothetical protein
MKRLTATLAASVLLLTQASAQESNTSSLNADRKSGTEAQIQRPPQVQKPVLTTPQISRKIEGRQVTYSGFLVDLTRAERPFKMLDLRTPAAGASDTANLYTDPQTGRPRGFVLFAIKF